ncbi:hypothetical protein IMG5_194190 [Ichthyophthirius multifiliis]|uniref:Uncharacterized protein n=1 Tax=Ichthyophthirius multifiliis TaxID=5932 RepID=G0R4Q0_ICHMU|nr:hypothetical protein IMG5_194190 [Ichthyophthirius multifiliis]EGR27556.1 hypothetical protein IMG5_194190 [Ichthyophthirius multifiliis]|eukprot:XP_004025008.1 hypothetical protein IMG5_194190 [Ichthyophthirius multifiliis]
MKQLFYLLFFKKLQKNEQLILTITPKDVKIQKVQICHRKQIIIASTNNSQIAFFDIKTGKLLGQYTYQFDNIKIYDMILIPQLDYIIICLSNGQVQFINTDKYFQAITYLMVEDNAFLTGGDFQVPMALAISKIKYCDKTQVLFAYDFKQKLLSFKLNEIINVNKYLIKNKKYKNIKKDLQLQTSKKLMESKNNKNYKYITNYLYWSAKVQTDQIQNFEYNFEHQLIFVVLVEKKVLIYNSLNGDFIETLRQSEQIYQPIPIGYRKKNTIDLYDNTLKKRIDVNDDELTLKQKDSKNSVNNSNNLTLHETNYIYLKFPQIEQDPYFFLNLIQQNQYKKLKSNTKWNLHINYEKYSANTNEIQNKTEKQVEELLKKTQVLQIKNQRFKIVRFQVDLQNFDPFNNYKPILNFKQDLKNQENQQNKGQELQNQNSKIWNNINNSKANQRNNHKLFEKTIKKLNLSDKEIQKLQKLNTLFKESYNLNKIN